MGRLEKDFDGVALVCSLLGNTSPNDRHRCFSLLNKISSKLYFLISAPFSSLSLFIPAIVSGLGYTSLNAQLMTIPPYAVAYVVTLLVSWSADRFDS